MGKNIDPKQQHPKFFDHPERYLGIDIECIKTYMDGDWEWAKGSVIGLSLDMLHCIDEEQNKLDHYIPKFKPQEGEQFIKDLEEAVTAGFVSDDTDFKRLMYGGDDESDYYYFTSLLGSVYVNKANIGICKAMNIYAYSIDFDTAAYIDTVRKLGYEI